MFRTIIFVFITELITKGASHLRVWTAVSNWSGNWFNGISPSCERDRIYFPETGIVSLTIPSGLEYKELVLPGEGELVLDETVTQFSPVGKKEECRGRDIYYNTSLPTSWFDPSGWSTEIRSSDIDSYAWDPVKNQLATPHLERIPCEKDVVKFPDRASFLVSFENEAVVAARWMHGEMNISEFELKETLSNYDTKFRFLNLQKENPVALRSDFECTDRNCFCDPSEKLKRLALVCSTPGASCEFSRNHCDAAIRPEGHCCPICGSLVHLQVQRENFLLSVYEKLIVRHLTSPEAVNVVQGYVGVTKLNDSVVHLQAVFTDEKDASRSIQLAKRLERELLDDMKHDNIYGIVSLRAEYSGFAYPALSGNFWTIFGMLLFLGIIACLVYLLYPRSKSPPAQKAFTFARFENTAEGRDSVSVVVETDPKSSLSDSGSVVTQTSVFTSATQSPSTEAPVPLAYLRRQFRRLSTFSRNFINPLFGNAAAEDFATRVNLSSLVQETPTSDNPFYEVASQQGLTDAELAQVAVDALDSLKSELGESSETILSSADKSSDLEASDSRLTLESIAEEKFEEISLEESKQKMDDKPAAITDAGSKPEVASARKTRKGEGKSFLKRVIPGRRLPEDSEVLVEKGESEA